MLMMNEVDVDANDNNDERRRQREREEEMERLLLQQDEEIDFASLHQRRNNNNEEDQQQPQQQQQLQRPVIVETVINGVDEDEVDNTNNGLADVNNINPIIDEDVIVINDVDLPVERRNIPVVDGQEQDLPLLLRPNDDADAANNNNNNVAANTTITRKIWSSRMLSYRFLSFFSLLGLLYYSFRTRRQYYLAVVFLCSSKWSFVIFGNAVIATALTMFDSILAMFLDGLRLQEVEGLNDFFRWNVTETCLALTMFRNELTVQTAIEFVFIVTLKCLHHVATMREQHLRLTQEAVVDNPNRPGTMSMRRSHLKLFAFLLLLQFIDVTTIHHSVAYIRSKGASVALLFAFEAAIMLISAWSHILLWHLHLIDSILIYGHEKRTEEQLAGQTTHSFYVTVCHKVIHKWKEYKPMFHFAIQLQSQGIQFIFYMAFFIAVLTFYGIPINLFREVYVSFISFKERLVAFLKYRQLMASMNRFDNVSDDSELDDAGRICIICRDEMSCNDCKKLPGCCHIFHKACLREWLVQQQSCPTCRADISANEALARTRRNAAGAADNRAANNANANAAAVVVVAVQQQQQEGVAQEQPPANVANDNVAATVTINTDDTTNVASATVSTNAAENTKQQPNPSPTEVVPATTTIQQETIETSSRLATTVDLAEGDTKMSKEEDVGINRIVSTTDVSFGNSPDIQILTPPNEAFLASPQQHVDQYTSSVATWSTASFGKTTELQNCIKESLQLLQTLHQSTSSTVASKNVVDNTNAIISNKVRNATLTFPALYKVTSIGGARVYDSLTLSDSDSGICRKIPFGTILVGQGLIQSPTGDDGPYYIKIPDGGCVMESLVCRVATIRRR